jgi:DNA-binding MarR family transcriptional regulator
VEDDKEQELEFRQLADIDPLVHSPARLMVLTYLYVVDSIDFVYLKRITGLSWGNLSTHLTKLADARYVKIEKTFQDKKPNTMIELTKEGRQAFRDYKNDLQEVLGNLPD